MRRLSAYLPTRIKNLQLFCSHFCSTTVPICVVYIINPTMEVTNPFKSEAVPDKDEARGLAMEVCADVGWRKVCGAKEGEACEETTSSR